MGRAAGDVNGAGSRGVIVAGGGPAGLEGALALCSLLSPERVCLIAPDHEFVHRPYAFSEAFGLPPPRGLPLRELAESAGFELRRSALTMVEVESRHAFLASGERLSFEALLVATGARREEALAGAITFWGTDGDPALAQALDRIRTEGEVTFAVPRSVAWSLPLYELALAAAAWCRREGMRARLRLLSGEERPVAVLGGRASARMSEALERAGVEWRMVAPWEPTVAETGPLISLPRLLGRGMPDLPLDEDRFLRVDDWGRVLGAERVYAAGDVTSAPIRLGGLSAQQADAAASAIAADLGEGASPQRFDPAPALRWWPAARVLGRHLSVALARSGCA